GLRFLERRLGGSDVAAARESEPVRKQGIGELGSDGDVAEIACSRKSGDGLVESSGEELGFAESAPERWEVLRRQLERATPRVRRIREAAHVEQRDAEILPVLRGLVVN